MEEQALAQLESEVQTLRAQREEISIKLAIKETELKTAYEQLAQAPSPKRPRLQMAQPWSCKERKPWRMLPEVVKEIEEQRAAGKLLPFGAKGRVPRVYVDGCFDMMHSGHMNAVRQAKLLADDVGGVLVVGVHTDAEIEKAKGPPVMRDQERITLCSAVKWVDELVFDTPYTASIAFLDSLDIDFCVHGDDTSIAADGTDAYGEAKRLGRIKIVKRTEGVSTTDLVGRLLLMTRSHHSPAIAPRPGGAGLPAMQLEPSAASNGSNGAVRPPHVAPPLGISVGGQLADEYRSANISSSGVSQFLATTWRLRQFSNGRTAPPGAKVVYCPGAFDLLHAGHVQALYEARRLGDFLLVGLHDDRTVNDRRGVNHPLASLHERALCVLALGCVDEVILGAPWAVSADLLNSMGIAVVAGGADECDLDGADANGAPPGAENDRYALARERGIYERVAAPNPLRIEDIVQRIVDNRARFEKRNAKREQKELEYVTKQKTYVQEL